MVEQGQSANHREGRVVKESPVPLSTMDVRPLKPGQEVSAGKLGRTYFTHQAQRMVQAANLR
jgi:hypothetical protein